ncbi:MAG: hypothetical protein WC756_20775 [Taibaiella sp.]
MASDEQYLKAKNLQEHATLLLEENDELQNKLTSVSYYKEAVALLELDSPITQRDYKLIAKIYKQMGYLAFDSKFNSEEYQILNYNDSNYIRKCDLASLNAKKKSIDYDNEANDNKKLEITKYIKKLHEKHDSEEFYCNYLNKQGIETLESMSEEAKANTKNIKMLLDFYVEYEYGMDNNLIPEDELPWNDTIHEDVLLKIMDLNKYCTTDDQLDIKEYKKFHKSLAIIYLNRNSKDDLCKAEEHFMQSINGFSSYLTVGDLYFEKKYYDIAKKYYEAILEKFNMEANSKKQIEEKIKQSDCFAKSLSLERPLSPVRSPTPGLTPSWDSTAPKNNKNVEEKENVTVVNSNSNNEMEHENKRMCYGKSNDGI